MEPAQKADIVQAIATANGVECFNLIQRALEHPGLYTFDNIIGLDNVQSLASSQPHALQQLEIFACGTYKDYVACDWLPALTPLQALKLRHLTIMTLASRSKLLPYSLLSNHLGLAQARALEDVVIEGIYRGVLGGAIDQVEQQVEIDWTIGRDVRPEQVQPIVEQLSSWAMTCQAALSLAGQLSAIADKNKAEERERAANQKAAVERARQAVGRRKEGWEARGRGKAFSSQEYQQESRRGGKRGAQDQDGYP